MCPLVPWVCEKGHYVRTVSHEGCFWQVKLTDSKQACEPCRWVLWEQISIGFVRINLHHLLCWCTFGETALLCFLGNWVSNVEEWRPSSNNSRLHVHFDRYQSVHSDTECDQSCTIVTVKNTVESSAKATIKSVNSFCQIKWVFSKGNPFY